ncbi:MAG: ATP-binding protein [Prevotella sp.]|nr:ATP-binding protein [Prevotella sp.]
MIDFSNSFIYPDNYTRIRERLLPEELYDKFNKKILFRIKASPDNPYRITPPNGLLVYGPPCNGKSTIVRQFAEMTSLPYVIVNRHDIVGQDGIHTNLGFKNLFEVAKTTPCIVIIENIETIIPSRKKITSGREYVDIMSNLSLINHCGSKGIFVFATTSKPKDIDSQLGMSGYLDELFYASYPDMKSRVRIIRELMGLRPHQADVNYDIIAKECVDFTVGDLVSIVDEIALNSAITGVEVNNDIIQATLETFRRPLDSHGKDEYDQIHSLLEERISKLNKTIGFR